MRALLKSLPQSKDKDKDKAFTQYLVYITSCLVTALENLHALNILYRNIQPESLYVDINGRVILADFAMSKVGVAQGERTYSVCGMYDYLAPEQVSQVGHGLSVDLWGLGVLLYELNVGTHPFAQASEVGTYNRICSFGGKSFPKLSFPDDVHHETKSLINQVRDLVLTLQPWTIFFILKNFQHNFSY